MKHLSVHINWKKYLTRKLFTVLIISLILGGIEYLTTIKLESKGANFSVAALLEHLFFDDSFPEGAA